MRVKHSHCNMLFVVRHEWHVCVYTVYYVCDITVRFFVNGGYVYMLDVCMLAVVSLTMFTDSCMSLGDALTKLLILCMSHM